ncbi:hypothetical protein ACFOW4_23850 [Micromonospora sp. GCM10011542]|uniref:hypothetical protein n=1 Tax=Micromonospora sp. GCM10011542 TaxID=3317337 RepID=UPI00361CF827
MSRRAETPPRGWQFWRPAFWTRPALLVLYGVLAGVLGLWALADVPDGIRDAVSMRRAAECPAWMARVEPDLDPPKGCLERIPVTVSGPWHSRGPGSTWHLMVEQDEEFVLFAETHVPTVGSRRLTDGAQAEALLWEGTPVAIELPAGGRVDTGAGGHRGWLQALFLGVFGVAVVPMLFEAARLKLRTTDGWWSVRGGKVGPTVWNPLMGVACLLASPSALATVPLMLGLSLRWVAGVALVGLGLAVYVVIRGASTAR